jgi:hypothetical protein
MIYHYAGQQPSRGDAGAKVAKIARIVPESPCLDLRVGQVDRLRLDIQAVKYYRRKLCIEKHAKVHYKTTQFISCTRFIKEDQELGYA